MKPAQLRSQAIRKPQVAWIVVFTKTVAGEILPSREAEAEVCHSARTEGRGPVEAPVNTVAGQGRVPARLRDIGAPSQRPYLFEGSVRVPEMDTIGGIDVIIHARCDGI